MRNKTYYNTTYVKQIGEKSVLVSVNDIIGLIKTPMKKKRKMLATGVIVTTMLLTGAGATLAQNLPAPTENARGLSSDNMAVYAYDNFQEEELANGKTAAEILEEQGFSPSQIQKLSAGRTKSTGKNGQSVLEEA